MWLMERAPVAVGEGVIIAFGWAAPEPVGGSGGREADTTTAVCT